MIFDIFPWPTGLRHRSQITQGPSTIPQTLMNDFSTPVSNESISHLDRVQWPKTVLVRWKNTCFKLKARVRYVDQKQRWKCDVSVWKEFY
jgi:hypothetical protein